MNYLKFIAGLIVGFGLVALLRYCTTSTAPPPTTAPPEAARREVVTVDSSGYAQYREREAKQLARIKALQRDSAAAKGKDKAATTKAHHSADTFAKTPTLDNCRTALADCQGENETKAFSLAVQERMLAELESRHKNDSAEIIRNRGTVAELSDGWEAANKALSKEQGKRFVLSAGVGLGITPKGVQPNVGLQVGWIIKRF